MPKIKNVAMLSIAVLVAQWLVSWLYTIVFGSTTQQLFSISIPALSSGIGGNVVGDKLLGYLSGIIPLTFSWMNLVSMFIGAFLLIWVGMFIYEQEWAWKGRNLTSRLFAILLYGHIALFAVLFLLKMGTTGIGLSLLIGLGINLLLVSALVTLSANKLNFPRI